MNDNHFPPELDPRYHGVDFGKKNADYSYDQWKYEKTQNEIYPNADIYKEVRVLRTLVYDLLIEMKSLRQEIERALKPLDDMDNLKK